MALLALILAPAVTAVIAWRTRVLRVQLAILLAVSACHLAAVCLLWATGAAPLDDMIALDELGHVVLSITSLLFFMVSLYCVPYLLAGTHDPQVAPHYFVPLLLCFLAAMTLVCVTHHLGLMWAAVEATTLASAPLVYFYRRKEALEAAWKYLLLCSVGIALALMATFLLGMAVQAGGQGTVYLTLEALSASVVHAEPRLLGAAFVFALVGYGTKMGLAPMHVWLPDAHSQAPSPVSALLSGAVLNCALLAILRFHSLCVTAGLGARADSMLLALGLLSMAVAAALMVGQRDYKRLFAYSSVENMGVAAVGVGIGGAAVYGAMLHLLLHSLTKSGLFLVAGNLLREFGTTDATAVGGALRRLPVSGVLLAGLLFAIGGAPPFGMFMSEFIIFQAAMAGGHGAVAVAFVIAIAVAFVGMATVVLPMLHGGVERESVRSEDFLATAPSAVLLFAVLLLGLYVPAPLSEVLHRVAAAVAGGLA